MTILDVARDAYVSQQTVSRVLRHPESVTAATTQRVRDAIDRLGYVPNEAARELRLRSPQRIGVLAHQLREAGPSSITTAAMQELQNAGYSLDLVYVADDDPSVVVAALSRFKASCSAVLAMMQTEAGKAQVIAADLAIPTFIDAGLDRGTPDAPGVEERIGAVAAEHFHALGHRSLLHLPGPTGSLAARYRWEAFRDACDRLGIACRSAEPGDWTEHSGEKQASQADLGGVTGIFAANDSIATGALKALNARHLPVPARVALLGVDDSSAGRYAQPPLSTIRHDMEAEGRHAASELLAALDARPAGKPPTIQVALVARQST